MRLCMGQFASMQTRGGDQAIEQAGRDLLNLCVEVAGGQVTPKAVELGQDDFIPWKCGVSL